MKAGRRRPGDEDRAVRDQAQRDRAQGDHAAKIMQRRSGEAREDREGQERLKIKAEARKWSFRVRFLYSGIKYAQAAIFGPSRAQKKEPTRIAANRLQPPTVKGERRTLPGQASHKVVYQAFGIMSRAISSICVTPPRFASATTRSVNAPRANARAVRRCKRGLTARYNKKAKAA